MTFQDLEYEELNMNMKNLAVPVLLEIPVLLEKILPLATSKVPAQLNFSFPTVAKAEIN